MMRPIAGVLLFVFACSLALAEAPANPSPTTWKRSTPEAQGLDSRVLVDGLKRIRDEGVDLHSMIVYRHGHVVLECYVHPYDATTLHNVKSVSKSVISAVTGIALDREILTDLDQPVHEFFPRRFAGLEDPRKKKITLRHLLTMTSGLELDENSSIMYGIFSTDDWIRATLERPMVAEPGTEFLYSTPLTHMLSAILTEAAGKSLLELTRQVLFDPLGIEQVVWKVGPQGYNIGGAELFLTPREMLEFGALYLNRGRRGERQVVPAHWVETSTHNRLPQSAAPQRYGYLWWANGDAGYAAMGWNGQAIDVKPGMDLVMVGTAADPSAAAKLFRGFEQYQPSDEPLPQNPAAVAELEQLVRELAHPTAGPVAPAPAIAKKISKKKYIFEKNDLGYVHLMLTARNQARGRLVLGLDAGEFDLAVGLDGVHRITETGALGNMPKGNRLALRGEWIDEQTFVLESQEIGDPVHVRTRLTFEGDRVNASVDVRPTSRHFEATGRAAADR